MDWTDGRDRHWARCSQHGQSGRQDMSSMQAVLERRAVIPATKRGAWKALEVHYRSVGKLHLRDLFANDPKRGELLTAKAVGLYLDYSKNRITAETLAFLCQLAEESGLRSRIDAMFRGDKINITENRA